MLGYQIEQSLPYYWGNQGLAVKMDALKKSSKEYNTYFIGSSRIRCHIIPSLFDSLNNDQTISYNLGVPAIQPPESYYFLEHFLHEEDHTNTKYIFVELCNFKNYKNHQLNARNTYAMNWELFQLTNSEYLQNKSYIPLAHSILLYLSKISKIGLLKPMLSFNENQPLKGSDDADHQIYEQAIKQDGYISHDSIIFFRERTLDFQKDIQQITKRNNINSSYYKKRATADWSRSHLAKIKSLITLAENKGVHLIFLMSPRIRSNSIALLDQIPELNKIDLGNPMDYPEFYDVDHLNNAGHLNEIGAHLLTKALSEKFMQLIEKETRK